MKARVLLKTTTDIPTNKEIFCCAFSKKCDPQFLTDGLSLWEASFLTLSLDTLLTDGQNDFHVSSSYIVLKPFLKRDEPYILIEALGDSPVNLRAFYRIIELLLKKGKGDVSIDQKRTMKLIDFQIRYHSILKNSFKETVLSYHN